MPKTRDYVNVNTLEAALVKEGLDKSAAFAIEPSGDSGRVKPVFLTEDAALILRLDAEGFEHRAPEPILSAAEMAAERGPRGEDRQTFVIPEGHEAVVDAEGRATGETRPIARTIPEVMQALAAAEAPEAAPRRSSLNVHVSDLFFNYDHEDFRAALAEEGDEAAERAARLLNDDAHNFRESVLHAFGMAIDLEELVADYLERL